MMKSGRLCAAVLMAAVIFSGCAENYGRLIEGHKAASMQEEGVWEERYEHCKTNLATDAKTVTISVNVMKDMSEDDMLEIMDYRELTYNANVDDAGVYLGKNEDAEYTCYAVFYRGDTDEAIKKIKYVNGESVEIKEEDEGCFAGPELRDMDEDDMDEDDLESE